MPFEAQPYTAPDLTIGLASRRRPEPRHGDYLVRYLARSSRFTGIGEASALRLWQAHGPELYSILAGGSPELLTPILGEPRAAELLEAWKEDLAERDVAVWLDENRFDTRLANKVMRVWGEQGASKLRANPYVMLTFANWRPVDDAARRVGVPVDDPRRLIGATEAALYARLEERHTATPRPLAEAAVERLLGRQKALAAQAVDLAIQDGGAIPHPSLDVLQPAGAAVMERYVERRVHRMLADRKHADLFLAQLADNEISAALDQFQKTQGYQLTSEQRSAVAMAVNQSFALLLGGAGVGKTTVLRAVHAVCELHGRPVIQMALAGKAAQRMRQATGRQAYTIAGFLLQIAKGNLDVSAGALVIIDEASMLDLPTAYRILRAIPETARLLLVGDPAQLPPIGFGLVFHVAANAELPRVTLTQVHRQAEETGIPAVSLAMRNGKVPILPLFADEASPGVSVLPCDLDQVAGHLVDVVAALGGPDECQILSPLRQGAGGVEGINAHFHSLCAPGRSLVPGRAIAVREPVIWTENDWDRGLMNGALGRITSVEADGMVTADFEEGRYAFDNPAEMTPMQLAYAITVHKAQGSQFRRVVMPVFPSRILDRTLIYTAITRATEQVVLIGDMGALQSAIAAPPRPDERLVGLTL
jgi:exodeoxyribonuclease V alpha subunit